MSEGDAVKTPPRWQRPGPEKQERPFYGPIRSAGGFYRTSEGRSAALGGIPLQAAEDTVVAAVRMAYKVAEAQVDRSERLASRLRAAGERSAGPDADRRALDATERLVFRAMMNGLSWLEGVAADRESPLKRLLAAEYRMLGSVLGLSQTATSQTDQAPKQQQTAANAPPPTTTFEGPRQTKSAPRLNIRHTGKNRRVVEVTAADTSVVSEQSTTLIFYHAVDSTKHLPIAKLVRRSKGIATIELDTPLSAPSGTWRAAVCDRDGLQLGFVQIVL